MSIHRTIEHEGQTYIVLSVDMRTEDNVVIAAPITGGRVHAKTGAVVSVAYDGRKQVRLVNPYIQQGLTGAQLRNAVMESAARIVRPRLADDLSNAFKAEMSPELKAIVERAING